MTLLARRAAAEKVAMVPAQVAADKQGARSTTLNPTTRKARLTERWPRNLTTSCRIAPPAPAAPPVMAAIELPSASSTSWKPSANAVLDKIAE